MYVSLMYRLWKILLSNISRPETFSDVWDSVFAAYKCSLSQILAGVAQAPPGCLSVTNLLSAINNNYLKMPYSYTAAALT